MFAPDPADPPLARSRELSKLWKKFCKTSCCVLPSGPGEPGIGEVGGLACACACVEDVPVDERVEGCAGRPVGS